MRHLLAAILLFAVGLAAQTPPMDPVALRGTRMLAGGGKLPPAIFARFLELAGGEHAKVVLIPTASETADDAQENDATVQLFRERLPGAEVTLLHTRDRAVADDEAFCTPLLRATGVWLGGGAQDRLASAYLGTRVERELMALLARDGVVAGTSAGTAIQTRTMIGGGMKPPILAQGFDCVPGAISDQHFLKRKRLPRLLQALTMRPGHFGIGVDEGTAVEIRGRAMKVLGASKAVLVLAAANGRNEVVVELPAGATADVGTWQRAARERAHSSWPPAPSGTPRVASGTLVIAACGAVSDEVLARFLELSGGSSARLVVVPAMPPPTSATESALMVRLVASGVRNLGAFTGRRPHRRFDSNTDDEVEMFADATGVWFEDGEVARLVDMCADDATMAALHGVLARGGVVGGNGAGAALLGDYLVRGNPIEVPALRTEGYWRGIGCLPGCAIDADLRTEALDELREVASALRDPLGIGISPGAAAIVRGGELEVFGTGRVAALSPHRSTDAGAMEPVWLEPGARYDLVTGARR